MKEVGRIRRGTLLLALSFFLLALSGAFGQQEIKLVPLSITLDPPPPVGKGAIVKVTTEVENQGTRAVGFPSEEITVEFSYLGARVSGTFAKITRRAISLDPEAKERFEAELDTLEPESGKSPLEAGTYRIFVQVLVTDIRTGTTTSTPAISTPSAGPNLVILPVEPKPDLLISDIIFTPGLIIPKGEKRSLIIAAKVKNTGTLDASQSKVEFSYRLKGEGYFHLLGLSPTDEIPRRTEKTAFITEDVSTWKA
ncbi:TPA: hypothetical protein EYP12_03215, partial [Candidatus Bipolaricaulota bacterium]|nr:hypothetical protein [Candidatus Bipolaricaulota bacterium]